VPKKPDFLKMIKKRQKHHKKP